MSIANQKQFFRELYASIESNCSAEQLNAFSALQTDRARFGFVHSLNGIDKFAELKRHTDDPDAIAAGKSTASGQELKQLGNLAFQAENYAEAVRLYSSSLSLTPATDNEGADVAIVLANRSAALSHLNLYDQALADVELALPAYPKRLAYKLMERKARCLLAKNEFADALLWFK